MENNKNSKLSILFVCTDDECISKALKLLKQEYNLDDITICKSKEEAYTLYLQSNFDIVLTNFLMSDEDGKKMVKKIREINEDQIFILISKFNKKKDLIKAIKLRIRYYIQYPIKKKELKEVFDSCIKRVSNRYEIKYVNSILQHYKLAVDNSTILSKADKKEELLMQMKSFAESQNTT